MRGFAFAISVAASTLAFMSGCATAPEATIAAPLDHGVTHNFPAGYEIVRTATVESMGFLNVAVEGADETPERYQVRFRKLLGGVAWGGVGVINVVRVDQWTTQVVVNSEPDGPMQRTSTRERQFADQVFSNIAGSLARQRQ